MLLLIRYNRLIFSKLIFIAITLICPLSISSQYSAHSDLQKSKILLLGEPDHHSYDAMNQKVNFIQYLVDSLHLNIVLAFESSLYDMQKANESMQNGKDVLKALESGIFDVWRGSEPIERLADLIEQSANRNSKIHLAGFDSQICSGQYSEAFFTNDLSAFLSKKNIAFKDNWKLALQNEFTAFGQNYRLSEGFDPELLTILTTLIESLADFQDAESHFWIANLRSVHGFFYDHFYNDIAGKSRDTFKAKDSFFRDSLMAENIRYLQVQHPEKVIVCWGATAHFSSNLHQISFESDDLKGAKLTGDFLRKWYRFPELVSIAFVEPDFLFEASCEGFVEIGNDCHPIQGLNKLCGEGYSTLLGNDEFGQYPKGNWEGVVDLFYFQGNRQLKMNTGKVIDIETGKPLPFSHVFDDKGFEAVSDVSGKFEISPDNDLKSLMALHVGYELMAIEKRSDHILISMKSSTAVLQEVVIKADPTDEEKALLERVIVANTAQWYNAPLNHSLYYQTTWSKARDTLTNTSEAVLLLYEEGLLSDNRRISVYDIQNKRIIKGHPALLPYPVLPYSFSNFEPDKRLLNKRAMKSLVVDSMTISTVRKDSLITIHYHFPKTSYKTIGLLFSKHWGALTFNAKDLQIREKFCSYSRKKSGLYHVQSKTTFLAKNDYVLPHKSELIYKYYHNNFNELDYLEEGEEYIGEEILLFYDTEVANPKKIERNSSRRQYEFSKAPYNRSFWKHYDYPILSNKLY